MAPLYRQYGDLNEDYGIIVQSRMGSNRLPGKMLALINGIPTVQWVLQRCKQAGVGKVILATTTQKIDDPLAEIAKNLGYAVYRGSEHNVLKRYIDCAVSNKLKNVIRICGDRPLVSPTLIADAVERHRDGDADLVFNHAPLLGSTWAYGFGCEVVSTKVLKDIYLAFPTDEEKEHVTLKIWNHENDFKIRSTNEKKSYQNDIKIKLDLDTREDLGNIRGSVSGLDYYSEMDEIIENYLKRIKL